VGLSIEFDNKISLKIMVEGGKSYETYKKVSTLGTGSFGTAYLVECQSDK
jgi:hypothetical protein